MSSIPNPFDTDQRQHFPALDGVFLAAVTQDGDRKKKGDMFDELQSFSPRPSPLPRQLNRSRSSKAVATPLTVSRVRLPTEKNPLDDTDVQRQCEAYFQRERENPTLQSPEQVQRPHALPTTPPFGREKRRTQDKLQAPAATIPNPTPMIITKAMQRYNLEVRRMQQEDSSLLLSSSSQLETVHEHSSVSILKGTHLSFRSSDSQTTLQPSSNNSRGGHQRASNVVESDAGHENEAFATPTRGQGERPVADRAHHLRHRHYGMADKSAFSIHEAASAAGVRRSSRPRVTEYPFLYSPIQQDKENKPDSVGEREESPQSKSLSLSTFSVESPQHKQKRPQAREVAHHSNSSLLLSLSVIHEHTREDDSSSAATDRTANNSGSDRKEQDRAGTINRLQKSEHTDLHDLSMVAPRRNVLLTSFLAGVEESDTRHRTTERRRAYPPRQQPDRPEQRQETHVPADQQERRRKSRQRMSDSTVSAFDLTVPHIPDMDEPLQQLQKGRSRKRRSVATLDDAVGASIEKPLRRRPRVDTQSVSLQHEMRELLVSSSATTLTSANAHALERQHSASVPGTATLAPAPNTRQTASAVTSPRQQTRSGRAHGHPSSLMLDDSFLAPRRLL